MEEILDRFSGKLYDKKDILNWNLPIQIQQQIQLEKFDYFFLASSKEDKHGGLNHVHLEIYPSEYPEVYLLIIETDKINPNLINHVLSTLKEKKFDIIVSNGFCNNNNLCYFGVYFSVSKEPNRDELKSKIKKIGNITDINIIQYTCEGCTIK